MEGQTNEKKTGNYSNCRHGDGGRVRLSWWIKTRFKACPPYGLSGSKVEKENLDSVTEDKEIHWHLGIRTAHAIEGPGILHNRDPG
jgi:hypothetical protein